MDSPRADLMAALAGLYESGKYSDLTIVCKSQRFLVHKAIFCTRSQFFYGACNGFFQESETNQIDLSDEDEEVVEQMIHYFYHLDYLTDVDERQNLAATIGRPTMNQPKKLNLSLVEDPLCAMAAAVELSSSPTRTSPNQEIGPQVDGKRPQSPRPLSRRSSLRHRKTRSRGDSHASHTSNGGSFPLSPAPEPSSFMRADERMEDDGPDNEDDLYQMTPDPVIHARMYAIAEKLGIPSLKALSKVKFERFVAEHWDEADFLYAMEEVYETTVETDRGLRNAVVQAFREHPELVWREGVRELVSGCSPLEFDLLSVDRGVALPF